MNLFALLSLTSSCLLCCDPQHGGFGWYGCAVFPASVVMAVEVEVEVAGALVGRALRLPIAPGEAPWGGERGLGRPYPVLSGPF